MVDAAEIHNCCPDNGLWLNSAANCSSQTMSALLCRWLNSDEVNLSIKVEPGTLEKAFANGYRFAEIFANATATQNIGLLHLDDLSLFRDSRHRNCAVENFTMLLPIFKKLGLSMPPEEVRKIVIEERGRVPIYCSRSGSIQ